jgi:hypothetical protein
MTNNQTNWQELCVQLYAALEAHSTTWDDEVLLDRVGTALRRAQSKPSLTVQDCNDMPKHAGNYIAEDFGVITLDGYFTREDLIEIANTVPRRA